MARKLFSVEEVDSCLAALQRPFGTELAPLSRAAGRILREPLLADRDGPPFARATMDGYALRWDDWAAAGLHSFHVAGQQWPGSPALDFPPQPGACVEIMTGAPCPMGADCVIPFEETNRSHEIVSIQPGVKIKRHQCLHAAGSDFRAGQVLVAAGTRLGAPEIGVAASCGYAELRVNAEPVIALVSTGDELVPVGETPAPYQIRSSNLPALGAALNLAGYTHIETHHLTDDRGEVAARFTELRARYGVIIVTGGISVGRKDWVAPVLSEWTPPLFHGVAQRPGKPMGCWAEPAGAGPVVFALPGNPVSALTGLTRYVLPWLHRNGGLTNPRGARSLPLAADCVAPEGLTWFLPVTTGPDGLAHPAPTNTSGDYAALHLSDGFLETPAAAGQLRADSGERFPYTPWPR